MAGTDSSSEDSSESDESDQLEEPDQGEVTTIPDRAPENQPSLGANTLLGNWIHIIENRWWEDNRDYLNLEQDLHWQIMIMQKIIENKEPWDEVKRVLMEVTSNYTVLENLNDIIWVITKENR